MQDLYAFRSEAMIVEIRHQLSNLDHALALERVGGDRSLLREIAVLFLDEYPRIMAEIRAALEAGNAVALERAAHSLKGSALGVGAFDVAKACEAAETEAHSDEGRRAVLLNHIRDAVDAALSDVAAYEHEQALKSLRGNGGTG